MALSKAVLIQVLPALAMFGICLLPTFVFSQAPFYQGKTITIVQGRDPGGTGDMRVRAMLPFLHKYIPGNPTIVNEYMPGGGSRKAANHIYQSARPDGLIIGNLGLGVVSSALLGETGVAYDLDKFFYLGSPFSSHRCLPTASRRCTRRLTHRHEQTDSRPPGVPTESATIHMPRRTAWFNRIFILGPRLHRRTHHHFPHRGLPFVATLNRRNAQSVRSTRQIPTPLSSAWRVRLVSECRFSTIIPRSALRKSFF